MRKCALKACLPVQFFNIGLVDSSRCHMGSLYNFYSKLLLWTVYFEDFFQNYTHAMLLCCVAVVLCCVAVVGAFENLKFQNSSRVVMFTFEILCFSSKNIGMCLSISESWCWTAFGEFVFLARGILKTPANIQPYVVFICL